MFAPSANIKILLGNIVNLPEITLDLILNKTVTDFSMSCSFLQSGSKAPDRNLNSILIVYCRNSMHTYAMQCNALELSFPV